MNSHCLDRSLVSIGLFISTRNRYCNHIITSEMFYYIINNHSTTHSSQSWLPLFCRKPVFIVPPQWQAFKCIPLSLSQSLLQLRTVNKHFSFISPVCSQTLRGMSHKGFCCPLPLVAFQKESQSFPRAVCQALQLPMYSSPTE